MALAYGGLLLPWEKVERAGRSETGEGGGAAAE